MILKCFFCEKEFFTINTRKKAVCYSCQTKRVFFRRYIRSPINPELSQRERVEISDKEFKNYLKKEVKRK